jgi:hypothetical protein
MTKKGGEYGLRLALYRLGSALDTGQFKNKVVSYLIKFGPHFPGETFRVLKEKEEKQYGEYRARRPILEACGAFDN